MDILTCCDNVSRHPSANSIFLAAEGLSQRSSAMAVQARLLPKDCCEKSYEAESLGLQEPKLTTSETSKTPMTLLLAFPKHSEGEHRRKVLRCGHKPPEESALAGEPPA